MRWQIAAALLSTALAVGSGAWSIVVKHREEARSEYAAVDEQLRDLDRNLHSLFTPIVLGLRAVGASILPDVPGSPRRVQTTLEAVHGVLSPGLPIEPQWFVLGPDGGVLASVPAVAVGTRIAMPDASPDAGSVAGKGDTPRYQRMQDEHGGMLSIVVPMRLAGGAETGAVVARLPVSVVRDRLFGRAAAAGSVLLVLDDHQVLAETHDAASDPSVAELVQIATQQPAVGADGPRASAARIGGPGRSYRVRTSVHREWGLRAVAAVADRGSIASHGSDTLRLGLIVLGVIGLIASAWWRALGPRRQLARAIDRWRQSRRAAMGLLDSIPQPIAIFAVDSRRARVNTAMAQLLGTTNGSARVLDWSRALSESERAIWNDAFRHVRQSGLASWLPVTVQGVAGPREVLARIVLVRHPLFGADEPAILVVLNPAGTPAGSDLGAPQLRELLRLAEAEKWHFGQALHDDLGQHLSGLAFVSNVLEQKLRKAARAEADDAQWLAKLADVSIERARALARGMVPVNSDDPGALALALREMCDQTRSVFGVECHLDADPRFDAGGLASANHLFHVVKELVANGVKHGHARTIIVRLASTGNGRRISVWNDGADLPAGEGRASRGMGLSGVGSRVAHLGGTFKLSSAPVGQGVLAVIELPHAAGSQARASGAPDGPPTAVPSEP